MSVLSGTLGAVLGADAQSDATKSNAQNVKDTNALNLQQFLESRGSKGSSVLPTYLKGPGADGTFESDILGKDLTSAWTGLYKDPATAMATYQGILDKYKPSQDAATSAANGIFNGGTTKSLLSNLQPLAAKRVSYARQTSLDALNKTLGQIEATQSQKGFVGDSSASRALRFTANKSAGDAVAGANLQNATDTKAIQDQGVMMPLQNLSLPGQMAQSEIQTSQLPAKTYLDQLNSMLQPLNFLRIGQGQFSYSPLPTVQPTASIGQNIAQGGAAAGNAALDYYLKQRQQQNTLSALKTIYQPRTTGGAATNPYSNPGYGLDGSAADIASAYNNNAYGSALAGVGTDEEAAALFE